MRTLLNFDLGSKLMLAKLSPDKFFIYLENSVR